MQERMTSKEFNKLFGEQSRASKYRNIKTEIDGHMFDSRAEASRYAELKFLVRSGKIKGFTIQPSFFLEKGIRYIADFMVCDTDGYIWVEDVKGFETKEFRIKKKLFEAKMPWLELRIIK